MAIGIKILMSHFKSLLPHIVFPFSSIIIEKTFFNKQNIFNNCKFHFCMLQSLYGGKVYDHTG